MAEGGSAPQPGQIRPGGMPGGNKACLRCSIGPDSHATRWSASRHRLSVLRHPMDEPRLEPEWSGSTRDRRRGSPAHLPCSDSSTHALLCPLAQFVFAPADFRARQFSWAVEMASPPRPRLRKPKRGDPPSDPQRKPTGAYKQGITLQFSDSHGAEEQHDQQADDIYDLDYGRYSERNHRHGLRGVRALNMVVLGDIAPRPRPGAAIYGSHWATLSHQRRTFSTASRTPRTKTHLADAGGSPKISSSGSHCSFQLPSSALTAHEHCHHWVRLAGFQARENLNASIAA